MKTLVILIGVPGSGKSFYAKELEAIGYVRINQDMFKGDRGSVTAAFDKALSEGKNIVLDRCNINKDQRRPWLNKAMSAGYEERIGVTFDTPIQTCITRIKNREGHETIPSSTSLDKIQEIVTSFDESSETPEFVEGFTSFIHKQYVKLRSE
tara:strand:- start:2732 stop:3187 length:456 start_codon:yes stop_codon:yes gene_type:complete